MSRCTVVVVDDAPDVRSLLRTVLEGEGFEVVGEARNGQEAIDVAGTEHPDLMVLDLSMPVMDGLEALPGIVSASARTSVVVLSGFVSPEIRVKVDELGATACVEKGAKLDELLAVLRELCSSGGDTSGEVTDAATRSGGSDS